MRFLVGLITLCGLNMASASDPFSAESAIRCYEALDKVWDHELIMVRPQNKILADEEGKSIVIWGNEQFQTCRVPQDRLSPSNKKWAKYHRLPEIPGHMSTRSYMIRQNHYPQGSGLPIKTNPMPDFVFYSEATAQKMRRHIQRARIAAKKKPVRFRRGSKLHPIELSCQPATSKVPPVFVKWLKDVIQKTPMLGDLQTRGNQHKMKLAALSACSDSFFFKNVRVKGPEGDEHSLAAWKEYSGRKLFVETSVHEGFVDSTSDSIR